MRHSIGIAGNLRLALRIQSLIADKGMIVASANRDLTCYGEWRTDYNAWHEQTDAQIQSLFSQSNAIAMASADNKTPTKETTL
jgi:hypothetical protein